MRKLAVVFVAAVFLPSLLLAALALRSLRDQRVVFERQQALLYQGVADGLARSLQDQLNQENEEFGRTVEKLLSGADPRPLATAFDERIRAAWPEAEVGFAVGLPNDLLAPLPNSPNIAAQRFRSENELFLTNRRSADVYLVQSKLAAGKTGTVAQMKLAAPQEKQDGSQAAQSSNELDLTNNTIRNVAPQNGDIGANNYSKLSAAPAEFRELIGDDNNSGIVARFLQNKLNVLFWYRSPAARSFVYGAQVNLARLLDRLRPLLTIDSSLGQPVGVALLDDAGKPVALSRPLPRAQWKHPFVATEVGEVLPHWEVAIYLVDPAQFAASARTLSILLALMIATLLGAITAGGWLIVTDLRRQLTLAQQKTDFVSNVSHELKTPLTSIRLFSELLADGRAVAEEKRTAYLRIIASEAERLTRLINNVLDFARSERGELHFEFREIDLSDFAAAFVAEQRPRLEANGWMLQADIPEQPLFINADRDALAQVLLNLISNAEKYAGEGRELIVRVATENEAASISVLDRGPGVKSGAEEKIFEQFYRAHDSLSSGIQGSGLGLTLARRIARAHGGELSYQSRAGGGSCFTLRLPLRAIETAACS